MKMKVGWLDFFGVSDAKKTRFPGRKSSHYISSVKAVVDCEQGRFLPLLKSTNEEFSAGEEAFSAIL